MKEVEKKKTKKKRKTRKVPVCSQAPSAKTNCQSHYPSRPGLFPYHHSYHYYY